MKILIRILKTSRLEECTGFIWFRIWSSGGSYKPLGFTTDRVLRWND